MTLPAQRPRILGSTSQLNMKALPLLCQRSFSPQALIPACPAVFDSERGYLPPPPPVRVAMLRLAPLFAGSGNQFGSTDERFTRPQVAGRNPSTCDYQSALGSIYPKGHSVSTCRARSALQPHGCAPYLDFIHLRQTHAKRGVRSEIVAGLFWISPAQSDITKSRNSLPVTISDSIGSDLFVPHSLRF